MHLPAELLSVTTSFLGFVRELLKQGLHFQGEGNKLASLAQQGLHCCEHVGCLVASQIPPLGLKLLSVPSSSASCWRQCSILGISCLESDILPNLSSYHSGCTYIRALVWIKNAILQLITLSPLRVFWFPSRICLGDHEPNSCQTKLEWEVCLRSKPHCTAPQRVLQDQIRASSQ